MENIFDSADLDFSSLFYDDSRAKFLIQLPMSRNRVKLSKETYVRLVTKQIINALQSDNLIGLAGQHLHDVKRLRQKSADRCFYFCVF